MKRSRRKTGAEFNEQVRETIYERAQGCCERCGSSGSDWQIHHRRPRGMGGTSRTDSGSAANALLLHPSCHEWVERNRSVAYDLGYLVHQQDDPCEVPVKLGFVWGRLTQDGSVEYLLQQDD
jgi:5-methylcytosine-specific restriction enzyme A